MLPQAKYFSSSLDSSVHLSYNIRIVEIRTNEVEEVHVLTTSGFR
jgi:hypothetical protein